MRYCQIPSFSATVPVLAGTPHVTSKFLSAFKIVRLLVLILCSLLLCGSAFSYQSGSNVRLIGSDASGVILELKIGDLVVASKELNNRAYHLISYHDCAFTSEVGKPRLPVSQVFLGVPTSASISVSVIDSQSSDVSGYMPMPVPDRVQRTSPDGMDFLADEFVMDREF